MMVSSIIGIPACIHLYWVHEKVSTFYIVVTSNGFFNHTNQSLPLCLRTLRVSERFAFVTTLTSKIIFRADFPGNREIDTENVQNLFVVIWELMYVFIFWFGSNGNVIMNGLFPRMTRFSGASPSLWYKLGPGTACAFENVSKFVWVSLDE